MAKRLSNWHRRAGRQTVRPKLQSCEVADSPSQSASDSSRVEKVCFGTALIQTGSAGAMRRRPRYNPNSFRCSHVASLTRRALLQKLSGLTAAGIVATGAHDAFRASRSDESAIPEPHISFPSAPRDRISVTSYPFRAYIESPTNHERDRSLPGMDLTDFAAEVVKKFNVHNIEPHSRHFRSLLCTLNFFTTSAAKSV